MSRTLLTGGGHQKYGAEHISLSVLTTGPTKYRSAPALTTTEGRFVRREALTNTVSHEVIRSNYVRNPRNP
jgi:hypothetical protein